MRISEEKFLELLDKNAVKYGIQSGKFKILDDGENMKLYKQYLQDENSARKLLELVQERKTSKQPEPESEPQQQVSAKALEVLQRLRSWLAQYDALSDECKLTVEMMMAELERQNAPVFELDLKIYLRELIAAGYVKVHREYRERLGMPAAVVRTSYCVNF